MFERGFQIALTGLVLLASAGGCGRSAESADRVRPMTAALLFGPGRSDVLMSTSVERYQWPASDDGYRLPDYSVYREYYYDVTGNRFNEQNYPRRSTWGYRIMGTQR